MIRRISLVAALLPCAVQAQQSVEYDISFPKAAQHEAKVVATFRGIPAGKPFETRMAKSSPGRYAPSYFAKNVYDVTAADGRGRALVLTRPDSHGWIATGHDGTVRVTYTVWGDKIDGTYLSIDHSHAHMNMPATFMYAKGMDAAPIKLTIHPREGWKVATQLASTRDSLTFTAPNLQYFLDSPTEVGPVMMSSWTSDKWKGLTWRIAMHHTGTQAQLDSFALLGKTIVDESIAVFGEPARYDYGTYTFLVDYLPWAGGDGMEHRNSTIISSRSTIADRGKRIDRLGTFTHEFFHSWNMERLRSKEIEPFNFDDVDMSSELWLGEGFTNYYAPLIIRRAGLRSNQEFIEGMGGEIVGTIMSPARQHGSAVDMSRQAPFFDGGSYLDPTNRQNTFISYYTGGSVVAMGLDLTLRTRFGKTLDDYMRQLWANYGRHQSAAMAPERPYTMVNLKDELAKLTGDAAFANEYFRRYIEGREVPDFAKLLEPAGFRLVVDSVESPYVGASMDGDTTRVFVNFSVEGSSMYDAGIVNGDLIYSIDGVPVNTPDSVNAILRRHKIGDVVQVDVEQKLMRRTIPMKIRGRRGMRIVTWESLGVPVTPGVEAFRKSWLGSQQSGKI